MHKVYKLIPLLVILYLPAQALAQSAADARGYYEDAQHRFTTEDFPGAIIQLRNALQIAPDNLPARVLLGQALVRVGDSAAAIKEIELAEKMGADPSLTRVPLGRALSQHRRYADLVERVQVDGLSGQQRLDVLFLRGSAYLEMGEHRRAMDEFSAAVDQHARAVLPVVGMGLVSLGQGRLEEAGGHIRRALELDPASAEAWYSNGALAYVQGRMDAALAHYARAIELQPNYYTARIARATALAESERYPEAVTALRGLQQDSPWDPQVNYLLAVSLEKTGDPAAAREALEEAARLMASISPEQFNDYRPLMLLNGLIQYSMGSLESAYNSLSDYVRDDPDHVVAQKLMGAALLALGQARNAVPVLKRVSDKNPAAMDLVELLASAYQQTGQHQQAVRSYQRVLDAGAATPQTRTNLGLSYLALKQTEPAIAELRAAWQAEGEHRQNAGRMLVTALLSSEQPDQALKIATELNRLRPQDPMLANLLGTVHNALGDMAQARRWYLESSTLDPAYRPALINLSQLDRREGRFDTARQRLRAVLKENKQSNLPVLIELARVELAQGRLEHAVDALEKARAIDDKAAAPGLALVGVHLRRQDPEAALNAAESLLVHHPNSIRVRVALGRAQMASGKPELARLAFKRAATLAGFDPDQLLTIAMLQRDAGASDDARWSLQKALEENPDNLRARLTLIDLQIHTERLEDAEELLAGLERSTSDLPAVSLLRGDLSMRRNDPRAAARAYARAHRQAPDDDSAVGLFRARMALSQAGTARRDLAAWVDKNPQSRLARAVLAETLHAQGDFAGAATHYQALLEVAPDSSRLLNNLANVHLGRDDKRALEYAARAHRLAPGDAAIADTYGWLLVRTGEPDKGLGYLRDASVRNSDSPEIRYHLGVALQALGRETEALEQYRRALQSGRRFPGQDDARRRLGALGDRR